MKYEVVYFCVKLSNLNTTLSCEALWAAVFTYFALHYTPPPHTHLHHMCAPNLSASVAMYVKAPAPSAPPHRGLRKLFSFAHFNLQMVHKCYALNRSLLIKIPSAVSKTLRKWNLPNTPRLESICLIHLIIITNITATFKSIVWSHQLIPMWYVNKNAVCTSQCAMCILFDRQCLHDVAEHSCQNWWPSVYISLSWQHLSPPSPLYLQLFWLATRWTIVK